jgi:hypothetical protein
MALLLGRELLRRGLLVLRRAIKGIVVDQELLLGLVMEDGTKTCF